MRHGCISTCNSGSNQDLLELCVEEAGMVGGTAASADLLNGPGVAAACCVKRPFRGTKGHLIHNAR